jgi:hypothetical protein
VELGHAFIGIGLAHVAPERAWHDLRSLFAAQWSDGRVPHIVFDPAVTERDYFPGPGFWRGPVVPAGPVGPDQPVRVTSGIVQPPVHALATWEIHRRAPDDASVTQLRWLYPRLVAQQDYLAVARDVGAAGLSSIVHPWESGLDNSPCWDPAMAAVPVVDSLLRRYGRRDNQVASVEHRPTDDDYARYLAIAVAYRDAGYRDSDLAARHPFLVECPGFNALRGAAELALARIAETIRGAQLRPDRARLRPAALLARAGMGQRELAAVPGTPGSRPGRPRRRPAHRRPRPGRPVRLLRILRRGHRAGHRLGGVQLDGRPHPRPAGTALTRPSVNPGGSGSAQDVGGWS